MSFPSRHIAEAEKKHNRESGVHTNWSRRSKARSESATNRSRLTRGGRADNGGACTDQDRGGACMVAGDIRGTGVHSNRGSIKDS